MSCASSVASACGAILRVGATLFSFCRHSSLSVASAPSVLLENVTQENQSITIAAIISSNDETVPPASSGLLPSPVAPTGARSHSGHASSLAATDDEKGGSHNGFDIAALGKIAWKSFTGLSKILETVLQDTPFATPLVVLNTFIDIGNSVTANKADMGDLLYRTGKRLEMVNAALLQTESEDAKDRIHDFADTLIKQATALKGLMDRGLVERIWENEEDIEKVKEILVQLDDYAMNFHIDISLSIERQTTDIFESLHRLRLDSWPRSRQAVYDADVASTLTRRSCTEGTRTSIIDGIFNWAKNSSSPPVYWLNGLAGTGKSTIAYTICQQAEAKHADILVASFFCSKQIKDARDRKHIIPTIVYQLARRSRSYAQLLLKADFDAVDSSERQLQELLVKPWRKSASERPPELPPRLIVVDALDECEKGYEFLRELLDVVNSGELSGFKFLVTSRPEPNIVTQCNGFVSDSVCRLHEVETEEVHADVRTFLTKALPALHQKPQFEELVKQAGVLFIYAATAIRFISPGDLSEIEQVAKLAVLVKAQGSKGGDPYLLDDLYRDILREGLRISHGEEVWRRRLSILHTILSVTLPHSPAKISALVSVRDTEVNEDMVRHLVNDLHAILYISGSDEDIYWHHKSFLDFMQDSERAQLTDSSSTQIELSFCVLTERLLLCHAYLQIVRQGILSLRDALTQDPLSEKVVLRTPSSTLTWPKSYFDLGLTILFHLPLHENLYGVYRQGNALITLVNVLVAINKRMGLLKMEMEQMIEIVKSLCRLALWLRRFYDVNQEIPGILPPVEFGFGGFTHIPLMSPGVLGDNDDDDDRLTVPSGSTRYICDVKES